MHALCLWACEVVEVEGDSRMLVAVLQVIPLQIVAGVRIRRCVCNCRIQNVIYH